MSTLALVGILPLAALGFLCLRPSRAVLLVFLVAFLVLPNEELGMVGTANRGRIPLPGLPDWTRYTAPSFCVLLLGLLFHLHRWRALRPCWLDLPAAGLCIMDLLTSLANGLGAYDGVAAASYPTLLWVVPYLAGRVYFARRRTHPLLLRAILVAGLCCVLPSLWEIRMSPQVHHLAYGYHGHQFSQAIRGDSFRPKLFLDHGLQLGLWLAVSTVLAAVLSLRRERVLGIPAGWAAVALGLTTVLARSMGAIALMLLGLVVLYATVRLRSRWPLATVALLPVLYLGGRLSDQLPMGQVVAAARWSMGAERADSLAFRVSNEEILMDKALQRPVLGWGGWGRSRVYDEHGKDLSTVDARWILILGTNGLLGLGTLWAFLLLPIYRFLAQVPARRWLQPDVIPSLGICLALLLFAIDSLVNAFFFPPFMLCLGALVGSLQGAAPANGGTRARQQRDPEPNRWRHRAPRPPAAAPPAP